MNNKEAIKEIKNLKGLTILDNTINLDSEMISKKEVLNIVKQLDESEKPVVPQFVADWYEENKDDFEFSLYTLVTEFRQRKLNKKLHTWYGNLENKPTETLVMMHKFGYEVEKEKLYTVELPDPNGGGHVILCKNGDGTVSIAFSSVARWRGSKNVQLTESEIKQDFDWAFRWAKEVEE